MKEKRNPAYWNDNIKRVHTAKNRNLKVINKPIYVSKISDFVNEFNRIKYISNKSKKRMKERHFTTMENIDKILKLDIIELSVLNEFIIIYNVFEHAGKVDKLDIAELISNLSKSLEII